MGRGNEMEGGRGREGERLLIIFSLVSLHLQEYIACTQVWIEYVAKHFTVSQNIVMISYLETKIQ